MDKKILIIEDEVSIQGILKNYLETAGYNVELASDGLEGFSMFQKDTYDLILLDVMMPKIDGYIVLEMIRKESNVPVMMITAMGEEENQMKAFELEVDDYIIKPFIPGLVMKRIEAVLRRSNTKKEVNHLLKYKELTLDTEGCQVFLSGKAIYLTHKEYELLKLFLENQNRVFSREVLLEKLWGYDFYGNPKVVNVHVQNLRRKLEGGYIETVRGAGYKIGKEN